MTPHDNIRMRRRAHTAPLLDRRNPTHRIGHRGDRRKGDAILRGDDDRLCVVCGPARSTHKSSTRICSAFVPCAKDKRRPSDYYADLLRPRTGSAEVAWINDPGIDGSFEINQGLRIARKLLINVCEIGLPTGAEFLDTIIPQFIADAIAWSAIGARTLKARSTESSLQVYLCLSVLKMAPVVTCRLQSTPSVLRGSALVPVRDKAGRDWYFSTTATPTPMSFYAAATAWALIIKPRQSNHLDQLSEVNLPPYVVVDCATAIGTKTTRAERSRTRASRANH